MAELVEQHTYEKRSPDSELRVHCENELGRWNCTVAEKNRSDGTYRMKGPAPDEIHQVRARDGRSEVYNVKYPNESSSTPIYQAHIGNGKGECEYRHYKKDESSDRFFMTCGGERTRELIFGQLLDEARWE